jgi:hypothetical protein
VDMELLIQCVVMLGVLNYLHSFCTVHIQEHENSLKISSNVGCWTSVLCHSIFCTWLRCCVTNLKVAGSRPDEVNDFYQVT